MPTISGRWGPAYQRIVEALADDIAAGRLHQGQRLPTHRALATALGLDVTTVTRAYAEARRLELIDARTGRGTFVAAPARSLKLANAMPAIDLSMNLPPQPDGGDLDARLAATLSDIRRQSGFAPHLTYQQAGGSPAERAIAAAWLSPCLTGITAERTVVAPGTQAMLMALLLMLAKPGDTVLTEALTYPGLKSAAALARVKLHGLAMDQEGIDPDALDQACRRGSPRVLVVTPTMQNPTTATMSARRRAAIANLVTRHKLTLIEDDPYIFLDRGIQPIATLAPDQTYFVGSLSKCLTPGLRTSLLVAPSGEAAAEASRALRAVTQMPAPLLTAVALRWLQSGTADAIIAAVTREAEARQALCRDVLGELPVRAHRHSPHIWMPAPERWSSERFSQTLRNRGLGVVASDAFAVAPDAPRGIRAALGAARTRAELTAALTILRDAAQREPPEPPVV